MKNILIGWGLALGLALVLSSSWRLDVEPEFTAAQQDAIQQLQEEARKERAARAICIEAYGEQTAHTWTYDGSLMCVTRRGEQLAGVKP